MVNSITSINSLLVGLKTASSCILPRLQELGFNTSLSLGPEQEYSVKTLIHTVDNLSIQFLTITAKRNQFVQRTSFTERKEIESCLNYLHSCLEQTQLELGEFNKENCQCSEELALSYTNDSGQNTSLKLLDAAHYIDLLKPYSRMLEMVTAQERIHALSAVLETLLSKSHATKADFEDSDSELTTEQSGALELSQYLIRQAL